MDLPKFIDMLQSRNLRLARADTLGDNLEGSLPRENMLAREDLISTIVKDSGDVRRYSLDDIRRLMDSSDEAMKRSVYASCWYSGEVENAVMWRAYASGSAGGIVLQSTYARLRDNINSSEHNVYIGEITYLDYHGDEAAIIQSNMFAPFTYKRKEFEGEREVRVISSALGKEPSPPLSLDLPIDVPRVVETVRIYPGAPYWQRLTLSRLMQRYGVELNVMASKIDEAPSL